MFSVVFCRLSTIFSCPSNSNLLLHIIQIPYECDHWDFSSSSFGETFGIFLGPGWGGECIPDVYVALFCTYIHYVVQPLVNGRRLTAICIQCIDIVNTTIGCIMQMMIRRTSGTIFVYPRPKPSSPDNVFFPHPVEMKRFTWLNLGRNH